MKYSLFFTNVSFLQIIQADMRFIVDTLGPLYQAIKSYQKKSAGDVDALGTFKSLRYTIHWLKYEISAFLFFFRDSWEKVQGGEYSDALNKMLQAMPASTSRVVGVAFKKSGEALTQKVDSILAKTVKPQAMAASKCMRSLCPSALQSAAMCSAAQMQKSIPLIDQNEWDKYLTLPAPQPAPTTTAGRIQWWLNRSSDFPQLASVAIAYLLVPYILLRGGPWFQDKTLYPTSLLNDQGF